MTATVELLQALIRNRCVNDGTAESGEEARNAALLAGFLEGPGIELERFTAAPGRESLVARIAGREAGAPSLCLMGHTDVVPVDYEGWSRDPFGGELVDGEVWGRGAVDMLNLTASMAVAFRDLAAGGFRPRGDLIFFAVADEESGSAYGARWMADHHLDAMKADYVLTENGGVHSGAADAPYIGINVAEKGVAWRRIRVHGRPGHGSAPFRSDNALVKAAAVITRLAEYKAPPQFHELWRTRVDTMEIDDATKAALLDLDRIDDFLDAMPSRAGPGYLHACTHTTLSPNVTAGGMKTNVIPGTVDVVVDIRTMPGEGDDEVRGHLRAALGDLADSVDVEPVITDPASISRTDTPLWDSLQKAVNATFPTARLLPQLLTGFTDARVYRQLGAIAYGAGLFSPSVDGAEFGRRFHGNDERIDLESLALTTQLWVDVVKDLLG
jgi:acetylornithine deacetylase/succinyl-diaminopimelate desuccinylase-like protein